MTSLAQKEPPQIVIGCSGAGHVLRGYEVFATQLYAEMKDYFRMRFCRGGGVSDHGERVLWTIRRGLTRGVMGDAMAELLEQASFATSLLAYLAISSARVVHVSEPWTARILQSAKAQLPFDYKIIFTNGGGAPPELMQQFDFVHTNSYESYRMALDHGVPPARIWFIPNAIHFDAFAPRRDRTLLRQKYGVPQAAFVVLAVSASLISQKRLDYLISELAQSGIEDCFLVNAGERSAETSRLEELALSLLGKRFRLLTVARQDMPEIYGLADVFVHCSLSEGAYPAFAVLEAIAAGLPVVVHRSAGFRWVFEREDWLVDMSSRGNLAAVLCRLRNNLEPVKREAVLFREPARARFDWHCARRQYITMYSAVLEQGGAQSSAVSIRGGGLQAGYSG